MWTGQYRKAHALSAESRCEVPEWHDSNKPRPIAIRRRRKRNEISGPLVRLNPTPNTRELCSSRPFVSSKLIDWRRRMSGACTVEWNLTVLEQEKDATMGCSGLIDRRKNGECLRASCRKERKFLFRGLHGPTWLPSTW
jgi:hypothetical protein